MEILEYQKYIKRCPSCKSELVYNEEDIRRINGMHKRFIVCPVCSRVLTIHNIFKKKYEPYKHGESFSMERKRRIGFGGEEDDEY